MASEALAEKKDVLQHLRRKVERATMPAAKSGKQTDVAKYTEQVRLLKREIDEMIQNTRIERLVDAELATKTNGKVVHYGNVIQLWHARGSKYVTVAKNRRADFERDAMQVYLDSEGTRGSLWTVLPGYKHRAVGDPVQCSDHVLLRSTHLASEMYLHLSRPPRTVMNLVQHREVNASDERTKWQVTAHMPRSAHHTYPTVHSTTLHAASGNRAQAYTAQHKHTPRSTSIHRAAQAYAAQHSMRRVAQALQALWSISSISLLRSGGSIRASTCKGKSADWRLSVAIPHRGRMFP